MTALFLHMLKQGRDLIRELVDSVCRDMGNIYIMKWLRTTHGSELPNMASYTLFSPMTYDTHIIP